MPPRTAPNKEFEVGWIGPDATGDFIAIAGQGAPATSFLDYARTGAGNPARLTAPDVGDYEVRYISATTLSVLARLPLSVMIGPAQSAITAPPEVEAGADVMVSVTDAGEPADYLTIVAAGAPDGALGAYVRLRGALEVSLTAPGIAGNYEIRQIRASGQTVLARVSMTVLPLPEAAAKETQPQTAAGAASAATRPRPAALPHADLMALLAVDRGRSFRIAWTGPQAAGDRIALLPRGGSPATALDSQPAEAGSPASLTAPGAPGDYEIVYVDGVSGDVLARRRLEVR